MYKEYEYVIVCSGAYESPKLLMLSHSNHWENGIGNDYDLLGRYLVSHSILKVRGGIRQQNLSVRSSRKKCFIWRLETPQINTAVPQFPGGLPGGVHEGLGHAKGDDNAIGQP